MVNKGFKGFKGFKVNRASRGFKVFKETQGQTEQMASQPMRYGKKQEIAQGQKKIF